MEETIFYVVGISLVVAALAVSALGLRFQRFPAARPVLLGLVTVFVALVGGTTTFAVIQAREEAREREAEEAAEAAEEGAEEGGEEAPVANGQQVFADAGCGGCHTLQAANSTGQIGPDLDQALQGRTSSFIRESIVDPNARLASGFQADVMPQTFGDDLSADELDALIEFLARSTGAER